MPELPEVETVVRGLAPVLAGRRVASARLTASDLYRRGSRRVSTLAGATVSGVERTGKAILIRAETGGGEVCLVVHLGMTGRLLWIAAPSRCPREKHLHARVAFDDGTELRYVDPRRFGYLFVGSPGDVAASLKIGPDPFRLKPAELRRALSGRRAPVKALLLDQRIVSGLGNIYVDELLFRAGIHPETSGDSVSSSAARVLRAARVVLRRAIRSGGTTIRDYRRPDGSAGAYQQRLSVYGRNGEACPRCGTGIVRIEVAQRGTHFCPRCQPAPVRRMASSRSAGRSRRAGPRRGDYRR